MHLKDIPCKLFGHKWGERIKSPWTGAIYRRCARCLDRDVIHYDEDEHREIFLAHMRNVDAEDGRSVVGVQE